MAATRQARHRRGGAVSTHLGGYSPKRRPARAGLLRIDALTDHADSAAAFNHQFHFAAARVNDGKAIFCRHVFVVPDLRDFLNNGRREGLQAHTSQYVRAFRESAQSQGAATSQIDLAKKDRLLFLSQNQSRRTAAVVAGRGLVGDPNDLDDLVGRWLVMQI